VHIDNETIGNLKICRDDVQGEGRYGHCDEARQYVCDPSWFGLVTSTTTQHVDKQHNTRLGLDTRAED
jgi:hypothetical protein